MDNKPAPKYLYHNDLWVLEDQLGLAAAGDQVARMALEVEPPFSLCVAGKWGAGKTSVLRRAFFTLGGQPLKQQLPMMDKGIEEPYSQKAMQDLKWEQRKDKLEKLDYDYPEVDETLSIWYSPWQYQNEPNPLIPLILELQAQFSTRLKLKKGAKEINRRGGLAVARLLEHLTDAAATLMAGKNINVAKGLTDSMRKGWQEAEPELTSISDGQRFHLLFEDAVKELLYTLKGKTKGKNARLIIFIDDLDRCESEVVVRLLEAIKLYLNSSNCVFILGLDNNAVMDALKKQRELPEDANREYLEKLFQATISVPLPEQNGICSFIQQQLVLHQIPPQSKTAGDVEKIAISNVRKKMSEDIEQLLEPNPRKIKNFINSLCATWHMHSIVQLLPKDSHEQRQEQLCLFIIYHYLRQYHQAIWRLLERQPEALQLLWKVLSRAAATEPLNLVKIKEADQRLLEEFFSRSFCHVLSESDDIDPLNYEQKDDKHRNQSLDDAIESFIQRQDRKGSDEYFVLRFCELHPKACNMPLEYLYIK